MAEARFGFTMRFRPWLAVIAAFLIVACSSSPRIFVGEHPPDVDLQPFWEALWHGDEERALAIVDEQGWEAAGSIEGERARQTMWLRRGRRAELISQLQSWAREDPDNPSLEYLTARLLQQPQRQAQRFADLSERWPEHAWIQLGAAGVAQQHGDWSRANRHLRAAPHWPDAREFRLILEARQLTHAGRIDEALNLLYEDAFVLGHRAALQEYRFLSDEIGHLSEAERARAEMHLRNVGSAAPIETRMHALMRRVRAEIRSYAAPSLEGLLRMMAPWSELLDLPTNWGSHPRYSVPIVGELLRPEIDSGPLMRTWREQGWLLLLGSSYLRGLEILALRGARTTHLDWPDSEIPVEMVLAESVLGSHENDAVGGAVFRGFYVRLDLARQIARAIARESESVDLERAFEVPREPAWQSVLPEDFDLPLRLRARRLREPGGPALRLVAQQVSLHEAGHLPEVLSSLDGGPAVGLAVRLLLTLLFAQNPQAILEYRAQARALASTPEPHWMLADVVSRARSEVDVYQIAYANLLQDLLAVAKRREYPPLWQWHELSPEQLRSLAQEVCDERGLHPLPAAGVAQVVAGVDRILAEIEADIGETR